MPDTPDASYFTDGEQLSDFMKDMRAADTLTKSSRDDAHQLVDTFRAADGAGAWRSLSRDAVAKRLDDVVDNPRSIQQGHLNLCGPASVMCCWAARDPVAFVNYATVLFETGKSSIGTLAIQPSDALLNQDLSTLGDTGTDPADWMFLGALRNTTNVFWQPAWVGDPQQTLAGMTRPEEVAAWMTATGIYSRVRNEGNWATVAGLPHAMDIDLAEGTDVILLINVSLLAAADSSVPFDRTFLLNQFPNHYVVLLSGVVPQLNGDIVLLSVWTWGNNKVDLKVPKQAFIDNYYGAVIASLAH
ncbi:hypothetical protein DID96_12395 [Burkholderia sp. Bp8963]|uniref:hypothetical protein n=1 Tax=Burkholderia sp. Bp8963 TaxID=2184547 RepID=UPI000F5B0850|nr:hypothetical protein [Burkholderia sp. Bp8963]RQS71532.1 hypothetical protein DID96_12395 [Burkholderia sp. Bp8963]